MTGLPHRALTLALGLALAAPLAAQQPDTAALRALDAAYEPALAALMQGRDAAWRQLLAAGGEVTYFGPAGEVRRGDAAVGRAYGAASSWLDSARTAPEVERVGGAASTTLAYTVGLERRPNVAGGAQPDRRARVTTVFRRDGATWRLIHAHRDEIADRQPDAAAGPSPDVGGRREPTGADLPSLKAMYEHALTAMLRGDDGPWRGMLSASADVTLLTPFGAVRRGQEAVRRQYALAASRLAPAEARVEVEYLAAAVEGSLGVVVALERSEGFRMKGDSVPRRDGFTRSTNVFRREADGWRLVHRHMDHLREQPGEAGR
jgi:ketosteroid isomerase-like protein